MELLHLDFETRGTVDLKKSGADLYARDKNTRVICVGWCIGDGPVNISPYGDYPPFEVVDHIANHKPVAAHNAAFEYLIWNYSYRREYPELPELFHDQLHCTMAMAYAMGIPGTLEKAALAMGIENQKDKKGHRVMLKVSKPRTVDPLTWYYPQPGIKYFDDLYEYCKQDVRTERELYQRLLKLSPKERALWLLDQKINQRGIAIDLGAVETAQKVITFEQGRLGAEMKGLTDFKVAGPLAVSQLITWLGHNGLVVDTVAKADVVEYLNDPTIPEICRKALLLRQEAAKSSTAKLESMLQSVCQDGRVRGLFQYHGASTGRWAGRRIQPQNFPRPNLKQEDIEKVFDLLGRRNGL